jgi:hypothetical protein
MPWSDYPTRSISIPADHGPTGPWIYVGEDDPIAESLGEDAAIVFHFGTHNSAFVMGVDDEMTAHDDGHFQLLATSDEGLNTIALIDLDYAPFIDLASLNFGAQIVGVSTFLYGERVTVADLGEGIHIEPYTDGGGVSAGMTVDVGGTGSPELVVNNTGVTVTTPAGDIELTSTAGDVVLNADGVVNVPAGLITDSNGHYFMRGETGTHNFTFTGVTSAVFNVTFDHPFSNPPMVTTNIDSGSGTTAQWHSRADLITTTGFQLFVFAVSAGTWSNIPVSWNAVEHTP